MCAHQRLKSAASLVLVLILLVSTRNGRQHPGVEGLPLTQPFIPTSGQCPDDTYQRFDNYNSHGYDIDCLTDGGIRGSKCRELCDANPGCVGFVFYGLPPLDKARCCYKRSLVNWAPEPAFKRYIFWRKHSYIPAISDRWYYERLDYYDANFYGGNIACHQDGSPASLCQDLCDNDDTCLGYNYIDSATLKGCCYKHYIDDLRRFPDDGSGLTFYKKIRAECVRK